MASKHSDLVTIKVSDGSDMRMYVARPNHEARCPSLIVIQEAFGVKAHIRDVADRLAAQGYLAAAPEFFHRTAPPGFEGDYVDFSTVTPHFQALTNENLQADLRAAAEWLAKDKQGNPEQVGAIGFCMGGRAAYLANAKLPLKAAVSFYGGRIAPDLLPLAKDQHGPLLLFWGGKDKHIGVEQIHSVADALKQAGKPFTEVQFSEADHGFMCPEKPVYHPAVAKQAWELTLSFLESNFK